MTEVNINVTTSIIRDHWREIEDLAKETENIKGVRNRITFLLNQIQVSRFSSELVDFIEYLLDSMKNKIESSEEQNRNKVIKDEIDRFYLQLHLNMIYSDVDFVSKKKEIKDFSKKLYRYFLGVKTSDETPFIDQVNNAISRANEKNEKIEAIWKKLNNIYTEAKDKQESINTLSENIKQGSESLAKEAQDAQEFHQKAKLTIEKFVEEITKLNKEIVKTQEQSNQASKKIDEILGDANRTGMAGSFIKRAKQLRYPVGFFLVFSILSALAIVFIGYTIFKEINENTIWYHLILQRIFIISPLVYLTWFFTKRYNRLALLQEKYTFKYTTALAFEGYKKEIKIL